MADDPAKCPRCKLKWSVLHQNGDCECESCKFKSTDNGQLFSLQIDDEWSMKWDLMLGQVVLGDKGQTFLFSLSWQPFNVDANAILERYKRIRAFW